MKKHQFLKRFSACVMVVIMTLTAVPLSGLVGLELPQWSQMFATKASAAETYTEGLFQYTVSDGEATITGHTSTVSGDLVIPETLGGYPVTGINGGSFSYCRDITSVTVPDSVVSIGRDTFYHSAWYAAQPDGDIYIGKVYYYYKGRMPENTKVVIKDGTKGIADYALARNKGLTGVTIPASVTNIGKEAFYDCTGLSRVTIPASVKCIGNQAFEDCTGLISINIPDSVISIGYSAFDNTAWYNNQTVGDVYAGKVYYKYKGTMSANTNIEIKNGTKGIAKHAFYNCSGLRSVTIPASVTNIDASAFNECTSLANINVDENNSEYVSKDGILFNKDQTKLVTYPYGRTDREYIIPSSVTEIGDYAFAYCSCIKSVTIPDGVTNIGEEAFCFCAGLTSVTIPDSVKCIDDYAFWACSGLTSVKIGNSVTSIGDHAFRGCTGLTSVTIPNRVTSIGRYAFWACTGLSTVIIPGSVTNIGDGAFEDCTNLKDVYYAGSQEQWNTILDSSDNDPLINANIHYNHIHSSHSSTVIKEATCTESGEKSCTCSVCGGSYIEVIPAAGHKASDWITDKDAACTESGSRHKECTVCKTVLTTETISAKGHSYFSEITDATCTSIGFETNTCKNCGEKQFVRSIPAKGHTPKTTTTKATTTKDGKAVTACTVCGEVSGTVTIYKASSVKLSKTSYTYNGKVQKPTVTVKDSKGKTLKNGTDYTVSYASGCKNTGKYAVKITFKGNYSGTKTLYFNILPSKTTKLSASQTTTSIKATWKAVTGATGYKVTLYTSKGKAVKTVYTTKTTASFSKLSKGTTYKVRVTAYKTIDGKKVASSVYTQITTATKPGTPSLKATAGSKKASLSWNKQTGASGYVVYMATSKSGTYKKIATVKGGTKVSYTKTGLTKGKTYYFKVRAYVAPDSKTTVYGDYSAVKSAKIK